VRRSNNSVERAVLVEFVPVLARVLRLPSIDDKAKMSKSQGNAIQLAASPDEIAKAVNEMYTAPNHLARNPADVCLPSFRAARRSRGRLRAQRYPP